MRRTIQEVEVELQKLNPDLTVRSSENSDLAGVYWKDTYTYIAMPKDFVLPQKSEAHCDKSGVPHRGFKEIMERVTAFLKDIENPEYIEYITEEFDDSPEEMEKYKKEAEKAAQEAAGMTVVDTTQPIG